MKGKKTLPLPYSLNVWIWRTAEIVGEVAFRHTVHPATALPRQMADVVVPLGRRSFPASVLSPVIRVFISAIFAVVWSHDVYLVWEQITWTASKSRLLAVMVRPHWRAVHAGSWQKWCLPGNVSCLCEAADEQSVREYRWTISPGTARFCCMVRTTPFSRFLSAWWCRKKWGRSTGRTQLARVNSVTRLPPTDVNNETKHATLNKVLVH